MHRHGIANVVAVEGRWPPMDATTTAAVRADVALMAHVGYDIEEIGPFLDAMESAAGRLCVAVLSERVPSCARGPVLAARPRRGARSSSPRFGAFLEVLRGRGRERRG